MEHYFNYDLENIETPLDADKLYAILCETLYDATETKFLVEGFTKGFDIGYRGPVNRQRKSSNIPFSVGDKYDMWAKIMKEVKAKCLVGPFDQVPFENFIQSPIGLVPKAGN